MNLNKPKKLKKGDTIGLLSISGDIRNIENIKRAEEFFKSKGFKTITSETTYKKFRYHAGNDKERLKNLHEFFLNDDINAIVCTRGGYGTLRLVNNIDYDIIKKHPKIFCGYSDITVLLLMFLKKTGLVTFHGAMANGDFGAKEISEYTENSFFETLYGEQPLKIYSQKGKTINSGEAEGLLWGGNLATIVSMIGLNFIPEENFVLFIEDVNENSYKIDRMLTQLFNVEQFSKNLKGIAVGQFTDTDKIEYVNEVLKEYSKKYQIPCCNGFKISHETDKNTLPVGVKCCFSANNKIIEIKEKIFCDE